MLTSPRGKSYIGQTTRPIEKRLEEHRTGQSSGCVAIYNAIQYHGWETFEKDWYECPDEDLNKHEELMVEVLGTLTPGGYNLKEGGANGKLSEETKMKIGDALRCEKHPMYGKTLSDETKKKLSEAHLGEKCYWYGKTHTNKTKKKMSEVKQGDKNSMYGKTGENCHMYGKTHTSETKQKMREAKQGEKHHKSKRVYQYDLEGNYIGSFGSAGEAVKELKRNSSTISACARGECKTAYGFKWSYTKS
jgi:group I intron endonuclease